MRTRSTVSLSSAVAYEKSNTQAEANSHCRTRTIILPSNATNEARFVSLENPRTGSLNQYYFCPKLGLYEFTVIKSPLSVPRSVLFAPTMGRKDNCPDGADVSNEDDDVSGDTSDQRNRSRTSHEGYISKTAELLVATPVDLIFFMLPILAPASKHTMAQKLFQPTDDILDSHSGIPKHLRDILLHERC